MMNENTERAPDIFDRIMGWRIFRPLQPFYRKYKEPLLYLFFGGLTTLVGLATFWLFVYPCGLNPLIANVISWVICVAFAYVTNRTWVFTDKAHDRKGIVREIVSFTLGRLATLGMEELVLWVGIDLLGINSMIVKLIAQVLVVIGNYVISKLLVFRKEKAEPEREQEP
jgi:putative flippase GtrA